AIRYLEAGHAQGKVIITVEQNNKSEQALLLATESRGFYNGFATDYARRPRFLKPRIFRRFQARPLAVRPQPVGSPS
ncbi:MAG TPA: hypothetical protein VEO53_10475, partial [Candidatus Binatia bacterium]|nr:hypothetical protein [Candidatus Binatia bacterium]